MFPVRRQTNITVLLGPLETLQHGGATYLATGGLLSGRQALKASWLYSPALDMRYVRPMLWKKSTRKLHFTCIIGVGPMQPDN